MGDMKDAYVLAAAAVRRRFAEQHPEDLATLERVRPGEVAVYRGSYDQVEETLRVLGIPTAVDPSPKALTARIVFVNCSNGYDAELVGRIGSHVEAGRWLVTSDWALHYVLEQAFPGLVRWNRRSTGEEVVSVEPALDSLWSDIVVLGADPQWWLWGSHPIEVLDRERVRVEAASHDLLKQYDAPVVAVRFAWGRGHVFNVISHFWAKRSGTPTARHQGSCVDFLRQGMRLSDEGVEQVMATSGVRPEAVNFAMLQTAATSTELVAQLCVRAMRGVVETDAACVTPA